MISIHLIDKAGRRLGIVYATLPYSLTASQIPGAMD